MPELRLRLYDTFTAQLPPLVPSRPGEVRIYCCGPTVYDDAHVGHARAALAPDMLVRHLRSQGLKVTYVRNLTDVDDKILEPRGRERRGAAGARPRAWRRRYQEDVGALGCADARRAAQGVASTSRRSSP